MFFVLFCFALFCFVCVFFCVNKICKITYLWSWDKIMFPTYISLEHGPRYLYSQSNIFSWAATFARGSLSLKSVRVNRIMSIVDQLHWIVTSYAGASFFPFSVTTFSWMLPCDFATDFYLYSLQFWMNTIHRIRPCLCLFSVALKVNDPMNGVQTAQDTLFFLFIAIL